MKFLVERIGGSMTSDRPETEQEDHQAILFSTGIFSDSDEEEENQFGLN